MTETYPNKVCVIFINKEDWPPGPWHTEYDQIFWEEQITRIPCIINRDKNTGVLWGYILDKENISLEHLQLKHITNRFLNYADWYIYCAKDCKSTDVQPANVLVPHPAAWYRKINDVVEKCEEFAKKHYISIQKRFMYKEGFNDIEIYADWLDEQGQPERAHLIRVLK